MLKNLRVILLSGILMTGLAFFAGCDSPSSDFSDFVPIENVGTEAKEEAYKLKAEMDKDIQDRKTELKENEERLIQRENNMDKREELIHKREITLDEKETNLLDRQKDIQDEKARIEDIKKEQVELLEKIDGYSKK